MASIGTFERAEPAVHFIESPPATSSQKAPHVNLRLEHIAPEQFDFHTRSPTLMGLCALRSPLLPSRPDLLPLPSLPSLSPFIGSSKLRRQSDSHNLPSRDSLKPEFPTIFLLCPANLRISSLKRFIGLRFDLENLTVQTPQTKDIPKPGTMESESNMPEVTLNTAAAAEMPSALLSPSTPSTYSPPQTPHTLQTQKTQNTQNTLQIQNIQSQSPPTPTPSEPQSRIVLYTRSAVFADGYTLEYAAQFCDRWTGCADLHATSAHSGSVSDRSLEAQPLTIYFTLF